MKDRKTIVLTIVSVVTFVAPLVVVLVGGTWDNLGYGTWRNTVATWSIFIMWISVTWLLVHLARANTPTGSITPWRRIGVFALIVCAAVLLMFGILALNVPVLSVLLPNLALALIPSLFTFPVWTLVAAIRGRGNPSAPQADGGLWEAPVPFTPVPGREPPPSTVNPRPGSRLGVWKWVVVAVGVVVVLVGAWVADQAIQAQELKNALTVVERSEAAMVKFNSDYSAIDTKFTTEMSTYGRDEALNRALRAIRVSGETLATDVKIAQSDWEDVGVLPWHGDLAEFKDDYAKHMAAWVGTGEYFASMSAATDLANPNPNSADISATFAVAGATARDIGVPIFAKDAEARISRIFEN